MTSTPFIGFLNNAALLLALGLIYGILHRRTDTWSWRIVRGLMLGIVAIGVMVNPWELTPGVVFDTRVIVLSVGGMFLGGIPTIIAAAMAASYRFYIGGAGVLTGILWVVVSGLWGLAWLRFRKRQAWQLSSGEFYLLGFSLAIVLLLLMFTMPHNFVMPILTKISLPVILIFPVATVLLAKLFSTYDTQEQIRLETKESERKYRELVQQAMAILLRIDMQGNVTFINEYAQSFFGFHTDEIVGENIVGTIVPEVDGAGEDMGAFINSILSNPEKYRENENENICKDGREVFVVWKNTVLRNEKGEYIGVQCVGHDITEQKRLQAQTIRSSQLASLGELSAGVAHEINNPLSGLINYADILKTRVKEEEQKAILDKIIREGERIAKTVKSLLSFARDDKGERDKHDIRTLIEESLALMKAKLAYDGISTKVSVADNVEQINCNAHQIEQILLNLLTNSRHALNKKFDIESRQKKIEIDVTRVETTEASSLKLEFTDNGTGIPADILPKVLTTFFTTKEAGVGTGLGMSICQDIIDLHQGTIDIASRYGEYTKVTIELPYSLG
jgi:PAS domain S-box-containing protein